MKQWNSLEDFFKELNLQTDYVVLRNYENFLEQGVMEAHADIDLLCRNRREVVKVSGAVPRLKKEDSIHYYLMIRGEKVDLDLRCVGDGYYDEKWEEAMLEEKRLHEGILYVLSPVHYYYSLMYHAFVQKNKVSDDYRIRLRAMREDLGLEVANEMEDLENYMRKNGYTYTFPEFPGGVVNFKNVSPDLIQHDRKKEFKRKIYRFKRRILK